MTTRAPGADEQPASLFREAVRRLSAGDPTAAQLLPELERFADYAPGWLALGDVFRRAKQIGAAVLAFRRAAQAAQATPPLLHQAGQALAQLGQEAAAMAAFRRALALDPGLAPAWYSLGLVLQNARQFAEAAAAFRQALTLKPGFHEAAFNLGVALQEDGRLEAALDAYAVAWRLKPESFGRIAQALISSPAGTLWLRPADLRLLLAERRDAGLLA